MWWDMSMCAGELALEEHRRTGPAVDAKVRETRLVHPVRTLTAGAGRLEETLHPDCAGDAAHIAAGLQEAFVV